MASVARPAVVPVATKAVVAPAPTPKPAPAPAPAAVIPSVAVHPSVVASVAPAAASHPLSTTNTPSQTIAQSTTNVVVVSHPSSSLSHSGSPTTAASQTGQTVIGSTGGSQTHHTVGPGLLVPIIVIACILSAIGAISLWRCARRKPSTELPPPNTNFFTPYWGGRPHSNAYAGGQMAHEVDEEGMTQVHLEDPSATPWVVVPYGAHSGVTPSDTTDSWKNSRSLREVPSGSLGKVVDLGQSDSCAAPSTRPPSDDEPLRPPIRTSDPFLSSSSAESSTSINNGTLLSPISPDSSTTPISENPFSSSPSVAHQQEDPAASTRDFYPPSRPPTNPRTPSRLQASQSNSRRQSRQSLYSLASGYTPSYYGGDHRNSIRGVPHKSNMHIILPEPLASTNDPVGRAASPAYLSSPSTNMNRRNRVDMWAETLNRSHTSSPRPTNVGHDLITEASRRRKSGESAGSGGDVSDRPRSSRTHPQYFVHTQEPPPLPDRSYAPTPINNGRTSLPQSLNAAPSTGRGSSSAESGNPP